MYSRTIVYFLVFDWPDAGGFLAVVVVLPGEGIFDEVAPPFEARFSLLPLAPLVARFSLLPLAPLVARLSLLPLTPVLESPVFDSGAFAPLPIGGRVEVLVGDFTDDVSEPSCDPVLPMEVWLSDRRGEAGDFSFRLPELPVFLTSLVAPGVFDLKLVPLRVFTRPLEDRRSPDFSRRTPGKSKCEPVGFFGLAPLGGLARKPPEFSRDSEGLATSEPSRDRPGRLALNAFMLSLVPDARSCSRSSRFVRPAARQGSFFCRKLCNVSHPPPTRTMTVLRRIRSNRSFCESPNRYLFSSTFI